MPFWPAASAAGDADHLARLPTRASLRRFEGAKGIYALVRGRACRSHLCSPPVSWIRRIKRA